MIGYYTISYNLKFTKRELKFYRLLTHIAKNIYNNALYIARSEYVNNGRLIRLDELTMRIRDQYYLALDPFQAKEVANRALKEVVKHEKYNVRSFASMPKLLSKDAHTSVVALPARRNEDYVYINLSPKMKINRIFNTIKDSSLRDYVEYLKGVGVLKFKIPDIIKNERIINVKLVPNSRATLFQIQITYSKTLPIPTKLSSVRAIGIDLGVDNLCACATNFNTSFLVDGKRLKSIIRLYNKKLAEAYSKLPHIDGSHSKQVKGSKYIDNLYRRCTACVYDYINKSVAYIIDYAIAHRVGLIVVGWNNGIKQKPIKPYEDATKKQMAKVNQIFMAIPFKSLRDKLIFKGKENGIKVVVIDEAFTSKKSFYDDDPIYGGGCSGKRIGRGLYKTKGGSLVNADINAALNILRRYLHISGFSKKSCSGITVPRRVQIKL